VTSYVTLEQALRVIDAEGIGPVLDRGLLGSALARPRASAFGEDAYPTLDLKAAALLHSAAKNHALVDGNKRLSWLLTETFVRRNACIVDLTNDQVFDLVMDVASGAVGDLKVIAGRLTIRPA
jgi:death-on-curing protein